MSNRTPLARLERSWAERIGELGSPRAGGRIAAILYLLCGALVATAGALLPGGNSIDRPGLVAVGAGAALAGIVIWALPWDRWRPSASLWLFPLAFTLIALHNHFTGGDGYRYGLFFLVCFAWSGLAHPPGTSTRFAPLLVVAYLAPLAWGAPGRTAVLSSMAYVVPVCVLVGETVASVSTRLQRSEKALRRSEERFRSLVQHASDVICVVGPDMHVLYISPAVDQMTGRTADELIGEPGGAFLHPEDRESLAEFYRELRRHPGADFHTQLRTVHADGTWRWNDVTVVNLLDDPSVGGIVATFHDLTERKKAEEQLAHQALHDALTGLPNRLLFLDRLESALARGRRQPSTTAVLFLDVDRFKLINDSLGHQTGDEVLIATTERLRRLVRPGDTVARLGGDEFVVCCEKVGGESGAVEVAVRILNDLERPLRVGDREIWVKVSIGVAVAHSTEERLPEELLDDADRALYRAKERGRARLEVFDDRSRHEARHRQQLENELRAALGNGELELFYQPEIDLGDGRLVGVEALLRWRHPTRGLIHPAEIIPIAEDNGLILPIGAWAIQQVCREAGRCRDRFGTVVPFSVNLSARQLAQPELVHIVADALGDGNLDPSSLCLEITESVLMEEGPPTVAALERLKALGLRLGIDDFGTGYSSLVYLKRLPVDFVKIDRSFVDGLGREAEDTAIVTAVLSLAGALGLAVVAEGIETEEQLTMLRRLGCQTGQGYYWSKPIPAAQLATWFATVLVA